MAKTRPSDSQALNRKERLPGQRCGPSGPVDINQRAQSSEPPGAGPGVHALQDAASPARGSGRHAACARVPERTGAF